jgi:hypothetical protein
MLASHPRHPPLRPAEHRATKWATYLSSELPQNYFKKSSSTQKFQPLCLQLGKLPTLASSNACAASCFPSGRNGIRWEFPSSPNPVGNPNTKPSSAKSQTVTSRNDRPFLQRRKKFGIAPVLLRPWTPAEIWLLGTMPDNDLPRHINRSPGVVKWPTPSPPQPAIRKSQRRFTQSLACHPLDFASRILLQEYDAFDPQENL